MSTTTIMFSVGDPSGDQHSAPIISQLTKKLPSCTCLGIGGPKMAVQGFQALLPFEQFNKMGYVEVLLHLPFFLKAKKRMVQTMRQVKPKALVCVDYYGFNLPLMKAAKRENIPVIWYITPKVWARKNKSRLTNLITYASRIAVIFPFEYEVFAPHSPTVSFVGNPLVEALNSNNYRIPNLDIENLRTKKSIRLALVPGSRPQEIQKMLPVMIQALNILQKEYPQISGIISRCAHLPESLYKNCFLGEPIPLFTGSLEELYTQSDLACVTSGTATLQTALMGIPMAIIYKVSPLTYTIVKWLTDNVSFVGLPNIIAKEEIVPELLQKEMTPEAIATALGHYLASPQTFKKTQEELIALKDMLGSVKPSKAVSELILTQIMQ